jgi:hypothetical protein
VKPAADHADDLDGVAIAKYRDRVVGALDDDSVVLDCDCALVDAQDAEVCEQRDGLIELDPFAIDLQRDH